MSGSALPEAYLAVVNGVLEAALLYDAVTGHLVHVNPEGMRRLREADIPVEPLDGVRLDRLVRAEDRERLEDAIARAAAGEALPAMRMAWDGPTGRRLVTSCVFNPIVLEGRRYVQLLARDVSHRVAAERAVRSSEASFRGLFDHSPVGMAVLEHRRFTVVNPALCRILARSAAEVVGRSPDDFTVAEDLLLNVEVDQALAADQVARVVKRYARPDGTVAWCELTALRVRPGPDSELGWADAEPPAERVLAQMRDITTERQATEHLKHAALHDPMTGLGNRTLLDQRLTQVAAARGERRRGVAVLFIDLDGFKQVNDALGHAVGDRVLKASAGRISGAVRPGDTVVRWGGDEFVVLLDGLDDAEEALAVVQRIEAAVSAPIRHRDDELLVTASVGVAYAAACEQPVAAQLLHDADAALYRAKQTGRNRHSVFDEALRLAASRRGHIESLLRLRDDDGRLLYPDAFLDIAEDTGLMIGVEHVVLHQACRWAAAHAARGRPLSIAVNVCAQQLARVDDLERQVQAVLARSGLPPNLLVCEVTEHAVLEISDHVVDGMFRLQQLGVEFSIDDFGAGHASINYLHRLPVQEIKIDRAYTARAGEDRPAAAIIRDVAGLARELGMRCVAEGVEHEAAHDLALRLGAGRAQGYLYSRPVPAADLDRLLEREGPLVL